MKLPLPLRHLDLEGLDFSIWHERGSPQGEVAQHDAIWVDGSRAPLTPASIAVMTRALRDDGVLIVTAPNRLALAQWAGWPDAVGAKLFAGIAGESDPSAGSWSRRELQSAIESAGLTVVERLVLFPRAENPTTVLSERLLQLAPELAAEIASGQMPRASEPGSFPLFPPALAVHGLGSAGLLAEFAPGFLFLTCRSPESSTALKKIQSRSHRQLGWHASMNRAVPTTTVFHENASGEIRVDKRAIDSAGPTDSRELSGAGTHVRWKGALDQPRVAGHPLSRALLQSAYTGEWDRFVRGLEDFVAWSTDRWKVGGSDPAPAALAGGALDAIWINAHRQPDGSFALFDLEWESVAPVATSRWIFRNVCALSSYREYLGQDRTESRAGIARPFETLAALYSRLCVRAGVAARIDEDLDAEARFQALVTRSGDVEVIRGFLRGEMLSGFAASPWLKDAGAAREARDRAERNEAKLDSLAHRATTRAVDTAKRLLQKR